MKKQTYSRQTEQRHAVWYTERLWELAKGLPVKQVQINQIEEFDQDCWFDDYPPTCREVARHSKKIMKQISPFLSFYRAKDSS